MRAIRTSPLNMIGYCGFPPPDIAVFTNSWSTWRHSRPLARFMGVPNTINSDNGRQRRFSSRITRAIGKPLGTMEDSRPGALWLKTLADYSIEGLLFIKIYQQESWPAKAAYAT